MLKLLSIFFPCSGCLVSRGAFGFVFVWVLVLFFTLAMCGLTFLLVLVFSRGGFYLSASNFPSPYFQLF